MNLPYHPEGSYGDAIPGEANEAAEKRAIELARAFLPSGTPFEIRGRMRGAPGLSWYSDPLVRAGDRIVREDHFLVRGLTA